MRTADVESVFIQVGVEKPDQSLLRFLWRADPQDAIEVFQYARHIFAQTLFPLMQILLSNHSQKIIQINQSKRKLLWKTSTWMTC